MAIMSRKKKAIAQRWGATNQQRETERLKKEKDMEQRVTPEEHERRIKMLKDLGIIKS